MSAPEHCKAINKQGHWKGKACGNLAIANGYCAVHQPRNSGALFPAKIEGLVIDNINCTYTFPKCWQVRRAAIIGGEYLTLGRRIQRAFHDWAAKDRDKSALAGKDFIQIEDTTDGGDYHESVAFRVSGPALNTDKLDAAAAIVVMVLRTAYHRHTKRYR